MLHRQADGYEKKDSVFNFFCDGKNSWLEFNVSLMLLIQFKLSIKNYPYNGFVLNSYEAR